MRIVCSLLLAAGIMLAQSDRAVRGYDRLEGRWNRTLAGELIRFADPQDTTKFLDYGCATGAVGLRLAVRFPASEVIGVDPSAARVEQANSQAPRTRVRFQTGDLLQLPFKPGTFDGTFSIGSISGAAEPDKALAEMVRVTKPEGVVAVAVWDYGPNLQPMGLFWNAVAMVEPAREPADGSNTPFSKQGKLEELFAGSGLRDVTARSLEVDLPFRDFDDYWSALQGDPGGAGSWLAAQSEATRNAVRDRLRARVVGSRADGPFTLRGRAWVVKGIARAR